MKELNDDMDDLFREVIEPNNITPSGKAWEKLNDRLEQVRLRKRNQRRYSGLALLLLLLLGTAAVLEYLVPQPGAYASGQTLPSGIKPATKPVPGSIPITKQGSEDLRQSSSLNRAASSSPKSEIPLTGQEEPKPNTEALTRLAPNPPESMTPGPGNDKQTAPAGSASGTHPAVQPQPLSPSSGIAPKTGTVQEQSKQPKDNSPSSTDAPVTKPDQAKSSTPSSVENNNAAPNGEITVTHQAVQLVPSVDPKTSEKGTSPGPKQDADKEQTPPSLNAQTVSTPSETGKTGLVKNRFQITCFYSPELTSSFFTKDHDSDDNMKKNDDDYQEREASGFSYNTGIKAGYSIRQHWTFFAGLSYLAVSQRIKPMTVFSEPTTDGTRHFVLNTSSGSAELPNTHGTPPQASDSLLVNSSSQALRFISVPLTAQFGTRLNKFYLSGFAGFSLNYLVSQKLIVEISKGAGADTYTITTLKGINKFSPGMLAGVGVGYFINERFSLYLEPVFKSSLAPINSNTNVKSYPYSIGVNCGLTYHL